MPSTTTARERAHTSESWTGLVRPAWSAGWCGSTK